MPTSWSLTIFVNPLQFGVNEDLDRYPRDLDGDLALVPKPESTAAFVPSVAELYPTIRRAPRCTSPSSPRTSAARRRPTHFDGVTTIVAKLLSIAGPCHAYFGRKDAQQLAVIPRMTDDLSLPARWSDARSCASPMVWPDRAATRT